MDNELVLRFKSNESFAIRSGWFDKAFKVMNENKDINVFSNANGVAYLGIGANMVSSLRYWLLASNLLQPKNYQKTELGKLIEEYDPYFENLKTWWVIHYNLATNINDCSVFYAFFNGVDRKIGNKEDFATAINSYFESLGKENIRKSYIEEDLTVCFQSYLGDDDKEKTPENNNNCPLARLALVKRSDKETIEKIEPDYNTLDYKLVYYSLLNIFDGENGFSIDDALTKEKGPGRVFNISRVAMVSFIERMQREGLVTLNRTAGLNTVYFEKKIQKNDLMREIIK